MALDLQDFMAKVIAKDPDQKEFHQAVEEVVASLVPYVNAHPKYEKAKILERIVEPERVIQFRIPWVDDKGEIQINRGYRVQMNSAIGPYKGGMRFHPSVNLGILKFLAFEQTFKNSLTTLPMGGGKGGTDFDGVGKSDNEVMRFCQSLINELYRHIGPNLDIPAGDIGVGAREVGYMYGQYRKLANEFTGVFTGKGRTYGGSLIRPEATGYGVIYFADAMLKTKGESFEGKIVVNSGYGNVGTHLIHKVNELGGKVVTIGDQYGYAYVPQGINAEMLDFIEPLWARDRRPAKDFADEFQVEWRAGRRPWEVKCDIACPTATQNEINGDDAKALLNNGCWCVAEGSNMSSTKEAVDAFIEAKILYAPGKASNAGGVAVSGLEMSQNSMRYSWTSEEVDAKLKQIMAGIHETCVEYGKVDDYVNYVNGANIGGFVKVAESMLAQGII
ncbi:MAG: NADP-specific glutamate dehydrogenase [Firmicutes bacterium]|nr:NADP-specific glutamate dehydrogenase [Bacillota bacterium]